MITSGGQHLLESVNLKKHSIPTKFETGISNLNLSDRAEMLMVKKLIYHCKHGCVVNVVKNYVKHDFRQRSHNPSNKSQRSIVIFNHFT